MGILTGVNKTVFRAPVISVQKSKGGTGYIPYILKKKNLIAFKTISGIGQPKAVIIRDAITLLKFGDDGLVLARPAQQPGPTSSIGFRYSSCLNGQKRLRIFVPKPDRIKDHRRFILDQP